MVIIIPLFNIVFSGGAVGGGDDGIAHLELHILTKIFKVVQTCYPNAAGSTKVKMALIIIK